MDRFEHSGNGTSSAVTRVIRHSEPGEPLPSQRGSWLSSLQLLAISAYWAGTNLHWGALLTVLIPRQIAELDPANSAQTLGYVLAAGIVFALLLPPIVGVLSDHCMSKWGRRRPYMLVGVTINIFGLGLLWAAYRISSLAGYALAFVVIQLGNNLATASYSAIIPDVVPGPQRGQASGFMAVMVQVGTIVGALAAGYLRGPGAALLVVAAALAVTLTITVMGTREIPLAVKPAPLEWKTLIGSFWVDPVLHPDFAWVWITRALVTMGLWMVLPFIQYFLRDQINVQDPAKMAANMMAVILIGSIVPAVMGGAISDRIGRKRVVYIANSVVAVAAIGFPFTHSLWLVWGIAAVFGIGYGAYYSVDWALGCDVLPDKENAAKDMGVWHIAMVLPQALASILGGKILTVFGHVHGHVHYSPGGYTAIFFLSAIFMGLGAVLLRNVRGVR